MKAIEVIEAFGHQNVRATHRTTFEITKDQFLTERGDCIIAVRASKGASDLSPSFKKVAMRPRSRITLTIKAGGLQEEAIGYGSPLLQLSNPSSLVARKSSYVCDRTLMINSNKAAYDLSRDLVEVLQNPNQKVVITLLAESR